jgi:hypothetical protein
MKKATFRAFLGPFGLTGLQKETTSPTKLVCSVPIHNLNCPGCDPEQIFIQTAIDLALQLAGIETAMVEYYRPPRLTIWSLLGIVDAIKARISGLSAEDMVLLAVINHNYPQPLFLYQS